MKKLLSLVLVTFMAMSMFVITASAEDGFNPADYSAFGVIGDWDFAKATAEENFTITSNGAETVTYVDGGVNIAVADGGTFPAITLENKETVSPTTSDWVYYELEVDLRNTVNNPQKLRWNFYGLRSSDNTDRTIGFLTFGDGRVAFNGMNATGSAIPIKEVLVPEQLTDEKTKIGYLVNISKKRYIGTINGELVMDYTLNSSQTIRNAAPRGNVKTSSNNGKIKGDDYSITIYDFKMSIPVDKYYTQKVNWNVMSSSDCTVTGGTSGTYTTSTTDGFKVEMTAEAALPTIKLAGKLPSNVTQYDSFYYEFVINTSGLSDTTSYQLVVYSSNSGTQKMGYMNISKSTISCYMGNNTAKKVYTIPEADAGKDITIGMWFDTNDPTNSSGNKSMYFYINRELFDSGTCSGRTGYAPYSNRGITITDLDTATSKPVGEYFVIKSAKLYSMDDSYSKTVIPADGEFTASVNYNVDTVTDGTATATVSLEKAGHESWNTDSAVVVASYAADGSLVDIEIVKSVVVKGGTSRTIEKTVKTEANGQVRVFLWDDMNTLVPVETFSPLQ